MARNERGGRGGTARGGTKRGRGRPRKATNPVAPPVENGAQEPQQVELQIHPDPADEAMNDVEAAHPTLVQQLRQQPNSQAQQRSRRAQRVNPPQFANSPFRRYADEVPPEQHLPQNQVPYNGVLYEHLDQPGSSSSGILQEHYNPDSQMAYEPYNPVAQPGYAHGQSNSNPGSHVSHMQNPASHAYASPPEMQYDPASNGQYGPHSNGSDEYVYSNQQAGPSSYYDPASQAYNPDSAEHNGDQQYMHDYHAGQYDQNQEYYQQGDPQNPQEWQEQYQNGDGYEEYEEYNQEHDEQQQQQYDENGEPMQFEQQEEDIGYAAAWDAERESRRAAYRSLYEAPHEVPYVDPEQEIICGGLEPLDQLHFADNLWFRESTVVSEGQYFTYSELLVTQSDGYCRFYRLPWNRQENIRGNPRLVYHIKNFKCNTEELNVGKPEMLTHLSVMMTANGDAPDVNMYSIWTVARAIQLELISVIHDIVEARPPEQVEVKEEEGGEEEQRREPPLKRTPPVTYGEVVAYLRDNCPMRLRRLVQFQTAEQERTNPLYRVQEAPPSQDHWEQEPKHSYLMEKLDEKMPKDVLRFKKACPILYRTMTHGVGKVENLRFYTCRERKKGQIDKNLHRTTYFKKYLESELPEEKREMMEDLKNVSMICGNGRKNAYFAALFHEFLGKPPLETDLIYVFDFLARELCRDIVTMAVASHTRFVEIEEGINCLLYQDAIDVLLGRQRGLLRGPEYDMPPPGAYPSEKAKKKVPKSIAEGMSEYNQRTNPLKEMRKILEAKGKKEKMKKMVKITGEDLVNAFVSMKMLDAHDAITRALPGLSAEQMERQKKLVKKRVQKAKTKEAPATSGLLKALGLPWASKVAAQEAKPVSRPYRHPRPTQKTEPKEPVRPGEPLQKAPFGQPTTCTRLPGNRSSSSESNDDEPVVVFARRTDQ